MTLILDTRLKTSLVPTVGSGSATFTRATSKTFINASDIAETVTSGNPALHSEKGALIDPESKTNNMLWCRNLAALVWDQQSSASSNIEGNGAFGTDITGWNNNGATLSLVSNTLQFVNNAAYEGRVKSASVAIEPNKSYVIEFDVVELLAGNSGVYLAIGDANLNEDLAAGKPAQYYPTVGVGSHRYHVSNYKGATANRIYGFFNASFGGSYGARIDNITVKEAPILVTKTQTGIDGLANECSLIEFNADGATILQTITAAAAAGCTGFDVKRHTGTGTIEITRDNVNWTDITNLINTDTFTTVAIENTSVTNPVVGFRGANGNKIIVDAGLNHLGTVLCEPIFTTTASVTRDAEELTYQTSGNFSDTAGTILATFTPLHDTWPSGAVVGKAGYGLLISSSNSGAQAADGTNTVNGATGAPAYSSIRIGCRWSGSSFEAFSADPLLNVGTAGSYDGAFNLSTIAINPGAAGYIKDVKVYDASLTDAEIKTAWSLLDSQTFLPAFSNLPIYNAGAIVHVEPDPPPVDPEPTPIFATEFQGWTVDGPRDWIGDGTGYYASAYQWTGSDSVTGFAAPTAAPLYALTTSGGGGPGFGLHNNNKNVTAFYYPSQNEAGVSNRFTRDIVDTTVRGVATKALRLKFPAPGGSSEFYQQAWFQIYRNVSGNPDLPESTTRFEIKLPDLSTVLPYTPNGRLIILDYKSSGDFRYLLQVTRYGVSSYRWQFEIDNNANVTSGTTWCFMLNSTETVPQNENFTVEFSFKRANAYATVSGVNAGKARVRIRRESDSVTTWRTLFDASESGIAAYNAINGSSNINRHMGINTSKMQRLFHGIYARKLNVDCAVEIADFRMFDAFDV